jgi:gliding motility-associated-like protein
MNCFRPAFTAWITCFLLSTLLPAGLQAQLRFVPNAGQWPKPFHYRADVPGGAVFLEGNTIWYNFSNASAIAHELSHPHGPGPVDTIEKGHAVKLEYLGASDKLHLSAENLFPTRYNYFLGYEKYWRSGLLASADIRYKNLYNGIDMLIEGGNDAMKYTFLLKRGADPSQIQVKITGAPAQVVNGALRIITTVNEIREDAPKAWQYEGDKKIEVPCRYVLQDNVVSFEFPQGYNPKLDLVIDPFVVFASYSGSIADNFGYTATYDDLGHAYGGGDVWAQGYPVTAGAYQKTFQAGGIDAGIMKYTPDGTKLLYATYLGGSQRDRPHSMIVNSDTELIVLGTTLSSNFPITKGAYDTVVNNYDIFITRFSSDGSKLLASTVVGGSARDGINEYLPNGSPLKFNYADDFRGEVIVDAAGDVYVASTTHSNNFPTTSWSMQPAYSKMQEAVVFRMNRALTKLKWGTYIGGTGCDAAYGMQFDAAGNLYVCGGTTSQNLFNDSKMYQKSIVYGSADRFDSADAFVCHLTSDSGKFINGTYLGANGYDQAYFVQVDTGGLVYLYGQTRSGNFPVLNSQYIDSGSGQFISILTPELDSLILSTLFGTGQIKPDLSPSAFLVDNCAKIYISGWGGDVNQPQYGGHGGYTYGLRITPDAFQKTTDGSDFYIAVFAPYMDTLLFASYFGNSHAEEHVDGGTSRFDKHAVVYQSVCGSCDYTTDPNPDPITTAGAHSRINKGKRPFSNVPGCNNLVLKLDVRIPDIIAEFSAPGLVCKSPSSPAVVSFINKSKRGTDYFWDFGDGTSAQGFAMDHAYTDTGTFNVRLIVVNPNSCSLTDTFSQIVKVILHSDAAFKIVSKDCDGVVELEATGTALEYRWNFGDGSSARGKSVFHLFNTDGTYTISLYTDSGTLCVDSSKKPVTIAFPISIFTYSIDTCLLKVRFQNVSVNGVKFDWKFGDNTFDTVKNPVHTYKNPGTYTVSLTITDTANCTATFQNSVLIKNDLKAAFTFDTDTCTGKIVFINLSKSAKKYLWNFGNGTTDTSKNPARFFTKDSLYDITLVAIAAGGCTDTFERGVPGVVPPQSKFSYTKDSCTSEVKFKSESFRGYNWAWVFGDGTEISHQRAPLHVYDKRGTYIVRLIINPGSACADTAEQKIYVARNKPTEAEVPNVFTPNGDLKNDYFEIEGHTLCYDLEIEIYNRWGQLVYKEKGNPLRWDGRTLKGAELPPGVYYYVFRDPKFGEKHGTVTLLRDE